MKKRTLMPAALTVAAIAAATLSLPISASADSPRYMEATVVPGAHGRDMNIRPVHDMRYRFDEGRPYSPAGWAAPHYPRGPYYRYPHEHAYRYTYGPGVRYEPRRDDHPVIRYEQGNDFRPIERYEPPRDNGIRVRISYDAHL